MPEEREKALQGACSGTPSPYLNIFIEVGLRGYEFRDEEGYGILKNVKSLVQLVCQSHGWSVRLLSHCPLTEMALCLQIYLDTGILV